MEKSKSRRHQTNYETIMMDKMMVAWVMQNAVEMEGIEMI